MVDYPLSGIVCSSCQGRYCTTVLLAYSTMHTLPLNSVFSISCTACFVLIHFIYLHDIVHHI